MVVSCPVGDGKRVRLNAGEVDLAGMPSKWVKAGRGSVGNLRVKLFAGANGGIFSPPKGVWQGGDELSTVDAFPDAGA
jgi:hypothetical protein